MMIACQPTKHTAYVAETGAGVFSPVGITSLIKKPSDFYEVHLTDEDMATLGSIKSSSAMLNDPNHQTLNKYWNLIWAKYARSRRTVSPKSGRVTIEVEITQAGLSAITESFEHNS